jgi:hypothetical protein
MTLNGRTIPPVSVIYNSEYDKLTLKEQINKDELILYLTDYQCGMCIDSLINILHTMDFFKENNITLWIKSSNLRYINWVEKNYNIKSDAIFKTSPNVEEELLNIELPYFFILEKETMRIYSTFIPLKENSGLTRTYLQGIKSKY